MVNTTTAGEGKLRNVCECQLAAQDVPAPASGWHETVKNVVKMGTQERWTIVLERLYGVLAELECSSLKLVSLTCLLQASSSPLESCSTSLCNS